MGFLFWRTGKKDPTTKPDPKPEKPAPNATSGPEIPGMNGALEVPRRPTDATVFEFGSAAASLDKVTIAGYCPVSDDLEPCRWEILPSTGDNAPQFRVVF